ncbi:PD-(D/E)XK nuclease family protein [Citrobacter freundii]|uniref:PD-(D/E)XK nuclease family protein n=1 Tax=Enterobacteriaceae TaxID=543 RepID=UPI001EDBC138|nr:MULTISPECIES: PD-(D/E)XK nuclease family protein [Enterobacteriaceae]EKY0667099.1 PD-(D/E)XK nuclease family protein [Citrobacter freundii]MDM2756957.1 PD-(D/E)XK nuclease family protein [Citrobacter sp. Cpo221]MDX6979359.1 PD-(D/E)XK nuclease family protein [Citrobacter freundii]
MHSEALAIEFIEQLKGISVEDDVEFNFFELGGSGYLENPTTDLMALFMGAQKMVPPWLLKALLCCLDDSLDVDEIDFTSLELMREARTEDGKYLDILIRHDEFIIGIEHKVLADTYNPFPSYVSLIDSYGGNNQNLFRCILKPDGNCAKGVDGWQLINYSLLLETAIRRLGLEMMNQEFSKWTVFYQEFLSHLKKLSEVSMDKVSDKNVEFVTENFTALIKSVQLLEMYQNAITEEAKSVVSEVLPDIHIATGINNWKGYYKAIHLMPGCWGQGKTGITLVYRPSEDGRDEAEFYVYGWIHSDDYPEVNALKEEIRVALSAGDFIPTASPEDYEVSITGKGKVLELSFWGNTRSKKDALVLLKDMTEWMDSKIRT